MTPNVFTTVYTVPVDRTLLVRMITLQNQGASASEALVRFLNSDTATEVRVDFTVALAQHASRHWDTWHVLEEGDAISLRTSVTNAVNYWISGALLLGDSA